MSLVDDTYQIGTHLWGLSSNKAGLTEYLSLYVECEAPKHSMMRNNPSFRFYLAGGYKRWLGDKENHSLSNG